jgi:hypothetical protein
VNSSSASFNKNQGSRKRRSRNFFLKNFFDASKVRIMKSEGRQRKNIIPAVVIFLSLTASAYSQPFALLTLSNDIPSKTSTPQNIESGTNQILPLIEMYDVPISTGIENLARQAKINYLIDAKLAKKWWPFDSYGQAVISEPTVTFRWKNLTARQALSRLLEEHQLDLVENPVTTIARIVDINQVVNPTDASLLGSDTNVIPLIQFQDVPITIGLENLARQAGVNYLLNPKIGFEKTGKNGQIMAEPILSIRWENITAKQAFIAICDDYDLVISKNPTTSIFLISEKSHPITNYVDATLLGSDTNEFIPIQIIGDMTWQGRACSDTYTIQIENEPFDIALTQLAKVAQIKTVLDPRLSGWSTISLHLRNITPKQAIVALCDIYSLIILKNSATGDIQIKPKD